MFTANEPPLKYEPRTKLTKASAKHFVVDGTAVYMFTPYLKAPRREQTFKFLNITHYLLLIILPIEYWQIKV